MGSLLSPAMPPFNGRRVRARSRGGRGSAGREIMAGCWRAGPRSCCLGDDASKRPGNGATRVGALSWAARMASFGRRVRSAPCASAVPSASRLAATRRRTGVADHGFRDGAQARASP